MTTTATMIATTARTSKIPPIRFMVDYPFLGSRVHNLMTMYSASPMVTPVVRLLGTVLDSHVASSITAIPIHATWRSMILRLDILIISLDPHATGNHNHIFHLPQCVPKLVYILWRLTNKTQKLHPMHK